MATLPTRVFPIGVQDFEDLRTNNYVYVDKTDLVYQLANTSRTCFLSRPRRFGKSLLLTTLKAYFEGKKYLFEGLAMEKLEKDWTVHPVLHISFASTRYNEVIDLHTLLDVQLLEWEKAYGSGTAENTYAARFKGVIRRAYEQTGERVVVLIDEYDSPILGTVGQDKLREDLRNTMRSFFSPLKDCGKYIRLLFITGITKFSQMSIFSELNNLDNISMDPAYGSICGITETELFTCLKESVEALGQVNEETYEEACAHLKRMYDGYHFNHRSEDIYNPFSIINVLKKKEYDSYWFSTGTPTFLMKLLKERNVDPMTLEGCRAVSEAFDVPVDTLTDPIPVLYQSGYLTIKDYRNGIYTLGYPNEEVRYGFLRALLPSLSGRTAIENGMSVVDMIDALTDGDAERCMTVLQAFVASIPYERKADNESRFETIFYILFALMGQFVHTQVKTAAGRADAIVENKECVYVFELKVDSTPDEALEQINEKGYAIPYEAGHRKVVKVGVNYDRGARGITGWKIEG
ncbi:MAG: ATP-binding protein [Mediterranea sp.]|jgi:hypothetical protein|nr:ATP-binding protein [Mediterranea sp.]